MPSSYTTNLGIELPADGEQDGIWGDIVNDNMNILDRAINGSIALSLSGTSSTLTTSDGTLSNGQYKLLVLAGSPSGTHTITIAPSDAQKIYFVRNTTAQSVVFTQGSGGNVTIATGDSAIIYSDGAGVGAAVTNITNDFAMSAVKITGGTITGITDLAVADGGTGASTAADARTNLGLVIGTNVQAFDADLSALAALAVTDGNFIVGNGTTWVVESGSTARTSLGLGTMATQNSASVAITGGSIAGITDLAVADGGTGASDAGTARTNLGLGTIATQAAASVSITGGSITGITDLAIADGGTGASDAAGARTNLGLGTMATQASSSVSITGGSITGITDITVADGGTGASTAADARTNLGLVIGTNVQAYDAGLQSISDLTTSANQMIYTTASDTYATTSLTAAGRAILDDADASEQRSTLGLGTLATQGSASVSITGGSITGISDLAIADGGTGASTAADARTSLGAQATITGAATTITSSNLSASRVLESDVSGKVAASSVTSAELVYLSGVTSAIQTQINGKQPLDADLTALAALAVTDGNFIVGNGTTWTVEEGATARTSLGLGTMATQNANAVSITGGSITGITDLAITEGGTGASNATDARANLGLGSMATQSSVSVTISGGSITGITDLAIADGGTGASDAAGARTNLGLAIGTNVQASDAALTALSNLGSGSGFVTQIADDTFAKRGISQGTGIIVLNGTGALSNPIISADLASQAEAEAGTDNTYVMTPLRTAQAITALGATTPFDGWFCYSETSSSSDIPITSGAKYIVLACGGGGSGAVQNTGSVNTDTKALGGNGGSVVIAEGVATSSGFLTVTIGAGGAARTGTAVGLAGSATTVVGGGINISAAGGAGGVNGTTAAIASSANAASSGGTVYLPGLWNIGTHTAGNISFSGTTPLGGGGTTPGETTTGMSETNDRYISSSLQLTLGSAGGVRNGVPWPLVAQASYFGLSGSPNTQIAYGVYGGLAGDASTDTDASDGSLGGGGGGGSDSSGMVSGAGGSGWVIVWQKEI